MTKRLPKTRIAVAFLMGVGLLTQPLLTATEIESWLKVGDELVETCEKNPATLVSKYFGLRERAQKEAKAFSKLPVSLIRNVIENERYFLLRDVFPEALPDTMSGKTMFNACAVQLESLNLSLKFRGRSLEAQEDLKAWRYCVDDSYREAVPEPIKRLQGCYAKITK